MVLPIGYCETVITCHMCRGTGFVRCPSAPFWKFWRLIGCETCHGSGGSKSIVRFYPPPKPLLPGCGVWTTFDASQIDPALRSTCDEVI